MNTEEIGWRHVLEITVARQWKLNAASPRLIEYVEHILQSMEVEALDSLKTTKFQIATVPSGIIWAYFPVHKNLAIVKAYQIELQSETEVLLVIGEDSIVNSEDRLFRVSPSLRPRSLLSHEARVGS